MLLQFPKSGNGLTTLIHNWLFFVQEWIPREYTVLCCYYADFKVS